MGTPNFTHVNLKTGETCPEYADPTLPSKVDNYYAVDSDGEFADVVQTTGAATLAGGVKVDPSLDVSMESRAHWRGAVPGVTNLPVSSGRSYPSVSAHSDVRSEKTAESIAKRSRGDRGGVSPKQPKGNCTIM